MILNVEGVSMRYLPCRVSLGFFETEFYVVVDQSSAFVSRENVRVDRNPGPDFDVDGQVLVYVVEEDNDKALVQLPGEPAIGGLRTWVSKASLAAA
jgi:hypothetical protein